MSKAKTKKPKRSFGKTTAKNLEAKFDAGEDVSDYFDWSKATRPGRMKRQTQAICDENQIAFRKQADGRWAMLIHEPLASVVRQLCKRRKISTREYLLGLLSQETPNDAKPAQPAMKKPVQNWKSIVLTTGLWPRTLVVPQHAKIPRSSKRLLALVTENEDWDYELIRGPKGRAYYLRAWPLDHKGERYDEDFAAPAARLTPAEAFRFAVANLVPKEILEDCPDQTTSTLTNK